VTQFVPVPVGLDVAESVGVEIGVKYVLTGPDGTRVSWNDRDDPDFIGFILDVSGFDGTEVRESADVIVEGDGGVHGNFYMGRRPWTLSGIIDSNVERAEVNRRIDKLKRATRALRGDAVLSWVPTGGPEVRLTARRQQPPRITQRLPKHFLVAMVSADPRKYSAILHSISNPHGTIANFVNRGDMDTPAVYTLRGAYTNPVIYNDLSAMRIEVDLTTVAGDVLVVDQKAHTVVLNGVNRYDDLDFVNTTWDNLLPRDNRVRVTGGGSGATYAIDYRDAWE
jgi:hypothetical protein